MSVPTSTPAGSPVRDLRALPKGHLHLHLEGAMRPATLAELADHYGMAVPEVRGFGSFPAFADLYVAACDVLKTWDDLRRVVRETVEDAARQGALWFEPQFYPPRHEHLGDPGEVVDVVLDEGARTAERLGIGFGLMVSGDRTLAPSDSEMLAGVAAERADRGVVAFGLANDEALWPPEPFEKAFAVAREAGLISAPHAGELAGPASVYGALDVLGADRIAHGVRAVEDPDLVRRLAEERICLDVCPSSNLLLSVVPSLDVHPLAQLLDAGVPCSLNSDDPLLFGPDLLDEYHVARTALGLSDEQLATVARSSFEASGAPVELRHRALTAVDAWLAATPE